jgi:hypothetical protein
VTHPFSIYIWQPERIGGRWIEPLQAYTREYALYTANLIHTSSHAVIKVVHYEINIACFPDERAVERVEKYIIQQREK